MPDRGHLNGFLQATRHRQGNAVAYETCALSFGVVPAKVSKSSSFGMCLCIRTGHLSRLSHCDFLCQPRVHWPPFAVSAPGKHEQICSIVKTTGGKHISANGSFGVTAHSCDSDDSPPPQNQQSAPLHTHRQPFFFGSPCFISCFRDGAEDAF